jgi:predicted DNA-binding transcriptional regulator AlpA
MSLPNTERLLYSDHDLDRAGLLSRKSRWRLRREGRFPEPVKVGSRRLYRAEDIHRWCEDPESWAPGKAGR